MSNAARIFGQASSTLETPLNIEEVFSNYLYDGTGAAQTITNGIDLAGEGGLVWAKLRTTEDEHVLFDTERGATKQLDTTAGTAEETQNGGVTAFNSDGFTVGTNANINASGGSRYVSWTFRKAPKFFDVVTWAGNGNGSNIPNELSHSLESVPGMIVLKTISGSASNWSVWHRGLDTHTGVLNGTDAFLTSDLQYHFGNGSSYVAPTSTTFTTTYYNETGKNYVAYLWGHNDDDGGFGPNGDADIIKCGSYTGNGSTDGPEIDLGFEPQWLLTKRATNGSGNWRIVDSMRGVATGGNTSRLWPNLSSPEDSGAASTNFTATGFKITDNVVEINNNGSTYIYIAIRRGPMAVPTDATDVFSPNFRTNSNLPEFKSGFVTDFALRRFRSSVSDNRIVTRLLGKTKLVTNSTAAESSYDPDGDMDFMNGWGGSPGASNDIIAHSWRRAPNFCDAVAYTGNSTAGHTISHNLGVAPEMIWVKSRTQSGENWGVYHSALGNAKSIRLDLNNVAGSDTVSWNSTSPTATEFTLGNYDRVNKTGNDYIAYLFASLDGVSKVGSYTGNGSTQNIDCGFSSGARFVLIKSSTQATEWFLFDSQRGILSGNDRVLLLDTTDAENASYDLVDPYSSGFAVNYVGAFNGTNTSGQTYIFYAIA
jgi:hypothetical protein